MTRYIISEALKKAVYSRTLRNQLWICIVTVACQLMLSVTKFISPSLGSNYESKLIRCNQVQILTIQVT